MKNRIIGAVLTLFMAVSMYAQNSNDVLRLSDPGIFGSARSLGLGNSIANYGGDAASVLLNPAGLGLYNSSEISFSGFNNTYSNSTLYFGNSVNNSKDATAFSQFSIVYKLPVARGSMVFAIQYNRAKDFNRIVQFSGYNPGNNSMIQDLMEGWNSVGDTTRTNFTYSTGLSYALTRNQDATLINGRLQQAGKTTDEGGINNWSFAGAAEVQKNLFVGATLNVISGSFDRKRNYYETDPYGIYSNIQLDPYDNRTIGFKSFSYYDAISWDISGWDLKLGFIYRLKDKATIGATIQLPKYITIRESYRIDAVGEFANKTFESPVNTSRYEYNISTPWEFSFGGSYWFDRLLVAADVKYIDYTQMKFTLGLTAADRDDINWSIKEDYRSVVNYNLGAEYSLYELGIKLRAGIMVMKSPYKGDASEYDKKFVTGGVGIPFDQLEINAGIAYGWWKDFGYNYQTAVRPVEHDLKSTTIMVSMKYSF